MMKSILNGLPQSDKDALYHAFEEGLPHIIILPNDKFIGVNVLVTDKMVITESKGVWSLGDFKCV